MSEKTTVPAKTEVTKPRRWDPYDLFTQAQNEFEQFWGGRWPSFQPLRRFSELPSSWSPRVDVYQQNGNLVVKVELPGMKKEDINIAIEDGDLVVSGERKSEKKVEEKHYYRMERSYGSFYRRLPLPEGITQNKIEATYAEGVLQVTVPKPEDKAPEPKKIAIK
jgi:HSP20 family protein